MRFDRVKAAMRGDFDGADLSFPSEVEELALPPLWAGVTRLMGAEVGRFESRSNKLRRWHFFMHRRAVPAILYYSLLRRI